MNESKLNMTKNAPDLSVHGLGRKLTHLFRTYLTQSRTSGARGWGQDESMTGGSRGATTNSNKTQTEDTVRFPLKLFLEALPPEVQTHLPATAQTLFVELPRQEVLAKIATGTFRITVGELRKILGANGNLLPGHEHIELNIPLNAIFTFINPSELPRKKPKKRVIPPLDIPQIFEKPKVNNKEKAESLNTTSTLSASINSSSTAAEIPAAQLITQIRPDQNLEQEKIAKTTLSGNIQANKAQPIPAVRILGGMDSGVPGEGKTAQLEPRKCAETPVTGLTHEESASETPGYIAFKISELWDNWPDPLKRRIELHGYEDATVQIPVAFLQVELKKGKVSCPADVLARWISEWQTRRLFLGSSSLILELPLKVIVPRYLSYQRQGSGTPSTGTRHETTGAPAGSPTCKLRIIPEVAESVPIRFNLSASKPLDPETKSQSAKYDRDKTLNKPTPHDLVRQAIALPGVEGALISLANGVVIAADLPLEFNPQAIAEMVHYTSEATNRALTVLRSGSVSRLSFSVGNRAWAIFKRGPLFLSAVSSPGQPLPEEALGLLANELEQMRQKQ